MKILVAEDDRSLSSAMKRGLEHFNHDITCVFDGFQAIDAIKTSSFDILLLDIMMPRMDGYKTASEVRKVNKDIAIIMVSAKSEIEDEEKGISSGADAYIRKPFKLKDLNFYITTIIERKKNLKSIEYFDITLLPSTSEIKCKNKIKLLFDEYTLLDDLINQREVPIEHIANLLELINRTNKKLEKIESKVRIKKENEEGVKIINI